MRLKGKARELDPERGRLGMHAMGPSDAQRTGLLARTFSESRNQRERAGHDHLTGGLQLQRQRGIENV